MKSLIALFVIFSSVQLYGQLSPFNEFQSKDSTWFYDFESADKKPDMVEKFVFQDKISKIKNLEQYPNLKELDLSFVDLKSFPKELFELKNLTALNLKGCGLVDLPEEFKSFTKLEFLILDLNRFEKIPNVISELPNLKCLHIISSPKLISPTESFKTICKIKSLEELRFLDFNDGTPFTKIPCEIKDLINLKYLIIDGTQLTEISPCMSELIKLEHLYFGIPKISKSNANKTIHSFPVSLCMLPSLTHLYLQELEIDSFPSEFSQLRKLKNLSFTLTKHFNTLSLKNLEKTTLKSLIIDIDYDVAYIPEEICNIKTLEGIDIISISLKAMPENIGNLKNLEFLSISSGKIEKLPDSFCELENLKHLYWGGECSLRSLPSCFYKLTNLEYLNLGDCKKIGPPINLSQMKKIKYLKLNIEFGKDEGEIEPIFIWGTYLH